MTRDLITDLKILGNMEESSQNPGGLAFYNVLYLELCAKVIADTAAFAE